MLFVHDHKSRYLRALLLDRLAVYERRFSATSASLCGTASGDYRGRAQHQKFNDDADEAIRWRRALVYVSRQLSGSYAVVADCRRCSHRRQSAQTTRSRIRPPRRRRRRFSASSASRSRFFSFATFRCFSSRGPLDRARRSVSSRVVRRDRHDSFSEHSSARPQRRRPHFALCTIVLGIWVAVGCALLSFIASNDDETTNSDAAAPVSLHTAHDEHATAVLRASTLNFLRIARSLLTIDSFVVFESDETSTSSLIGGTFYAFVGFALVSMLLDAVIARSTRRQQRAPPQRRRQRISSAHAATTADEGIERSGTFIWSSRKESELDPESHDRAALVAVEARDAIAKTAALASDEVSLYDELPLSCRYSTLGMFMTEHDEPIDDHEPRRHASTQTDDEKSSTRRSPLTRASDEASESEAFETRRQSPLFTAAARPSSSHDDVASLLVETYRRPPRIVAMSFSHSALL